MECRKELSYLSLFPKIEGIVQKNFLVYSLVIDEFSIFIRNKFKNILYLRVKLYKN